MRVLIITSDYSSERKVSLTSAKEVKKALIKNKFEAKIYDLKNGYMPIKELVKNSGIFYFFPCYFLSHPSGTIFNLS